MTPPRKRVVVGVMGAASGALTERDTERLAFLAAEIGSAIVARGCVLITGATTGIPDLVTRAVSTAGGLTIGISPAASAQEHQHLYGLPLGADLMVYTGFGLKGRNVINIRSSDIVLIIGGGMGTLNEFTIAYDEGKVIGVLEGSGGVADHVPAIVAFCMTKPTRSKVIIDAEPKALLDACLAAFLDRNP